MSEGVKLTASERSLLSRIERETIESRWDGADVPGLRALECAGFVDRTGQYGWTYRISRAGRQALGAAQ